MRYSMQTAIRFSAALPERKATHWSLTRKRLLIPTILSFPAGNTTTGYVPMPEAATTILYTVLIPRWKIRHWSRKKHRYAPWKKRAAKPTFWAGEKSPVLMAMKFSGRFPAKNGNCSNVSNEPAPWNWNFLSLQKKTASTGYVPIKKQLRKTFTVLSQKK